MKRYRDLSLHARVALLSGVLLLAGAGVVFTQSANAREQGKAGAPKLRTDEAPLRRDNALRVSFGPAIREASPSVVTVFTTTNERMIQRPGMGRIPGMPEIFGDMFPGGRMVVPRQDGLGSGVIVTEDGYILTNNHVVDGADAIKVALNPDGRQYEAKVIGQDPKTDLAVLKVDATGLPAIRVGNSDGVEVGDVVLAIGNPFGVGQTVTMGIVGATGRAVFGRPGGLEYEDFIQTDAAINRGNSGGALVDADGRLVGINTAILSQGGGNNGIGFSVPINLARSVMDSLVEHGRVIRGFLGVKIQDVTRDLAAEFGAEEPVGALVAEVTPRGPADKAGLQSGDVITRFEGREVKDSRHLRLMVAQTPPNRDVTVGLLRDGKAKDLKVVLDELPDDARAGGMRRGPAWGGADTGGLQGVVVADLTPDLRRQHGVPREVTGAMVTDVQEDSAAWDASLRPGDVIREINRRTVRDAEEAIEAAQELENARILLKVWRDGGHRFVVVDETKSRN